MTLGLNNLKASKKRTKKRVGRGNASGRGTYSGRGQKGQRSRSGGKSGLKRLGVKDYLIQLPKSRGFKSHRPKYEAVNISSLEKRFEKDSVIDPKKLVQAGFVSDPSSKVKILGDGELKKKFEVKADAFSKSAVDAINKAGGKAIVIEKKSAPVKTKTDKKK